MIIGLYGAFSHINFASLDIEINMLANCRDQQNYFIIFLEINSMSLWFVKNVGIKT